MQKFYKLNEIAERYQVSKSSVKNYIKNGVLPAPKKIGGSRRWSEAQLEEFEANL